MVRILFICHGNICRSPMAEYVMKYIVKENGYENYFYIASAATSMEEIGNHIHYGTRTKMREVGIPTDNRVAVQMRRSDYEKYDYIIGMDRLNYKNILRIIGRIQKGKYPCYWNLLAATEILQTLGILEILTRRMKIYWKDVRLF